MTRKEWETTTDIQQMLNHIWEHCYEDQRHVLQKKLKAYHCACCRRIWVLLPDQQSRSAIEHLEWFLTGQSSEEELDTANWNAEAVVLGFNYNSNPDVIARWCKDIESISSDGLIASMLAQHTSRELLHLAAQFAGGTQTTTGGKDILPEEFLMFHSSELLRQFVGW